MTDRRNLTLLGSFAYFAKLDLGKLTRRAHGAGVDVDFLADSGAFTAYTTGRTVTVKRYATWLLAWSPYINAAMTLDVIGDPAASARNTAELQQRVGDAVYVIPIFHVGSPWQELHRWCSTHPYVALGGGVAIANRKKQFMAWLVRCHRIAAEYGTALHGLGMTKPPVPDLLPWYSVDSSYWGAGARKGAVTLFDDRARKWVCVRYADIRKSLDPVLRARRPEYARLIRSYGGDPAALATLGFGLVRERGAVVGRAERQWLSESAAEAWMRYADHLRTRHRGLAAPEGVSGDGPKVYLAVGSESDWDLMTTIAATRAIPEGTTV